MSEHWDHIREYDPEHITRDDLHWAVAEIARLRAENARLREAIAEALNLWPIVDNLVAEIRTLRLALGLNPG